MTITNDRKLKKEKMKATFEIVPNEIMLSIFTYLSWNEILESFWLLNERFNSLVCTSFVINKTGIILTEPSISYQKFSSKVFPLICNSSELSSSIKRLHIDGLNSIFCDTIDQFIFSDNNRCNMNFSNLKSLSITRCLSLSPPLIETLFVLIQNQLEQLRLEFDADLFEYQMTYCLGEAENSK